jgi:hypothetical protein
LSTNPAAAKKTSAPTPYTRASTPSARRVAVASVTPEPSDPEPGDVEEGSGEAVGEEVAGLEGVDDGSSEEVGEGEGDVVGTDVVPVGVAVDVGVAVEVAVGVAVGVGVGVAVGVGVGRTPAENTVSASTAPAPVVSLTDVIWHPTSCQYASPALNPY